MALWNDVDSLLIPPRGAGEKLPTELTDLHNKIIETLRRRLRNEEESSIKRKHSRNK